MFSLVVKSGWKVGDLNAATKGFTLWHFSGMLHTQHSTVLISLSFYTLYKKKEKKNTKYGNTAESLEFWAGLDFSLYFGEPLKCHVLGRGHPLAYH